jgi:IS5 family transposase
MLSLFAPNTPDEPYKSYLVAKVLTQNANIADNGANERREYSSAIEDIVKNEKQIFISINSYDAGDDSERNRAPGKEQEEQEPQQENRSKLVKKEKSGVDTEARWVKKRGRLHYGYKQHTATNEEGLVLALITTPANESDTKHVEDVLDKIDTENYKSLKADKGYKSENNDKVVKEKKLRNHILHKAKKNKKLTRREIEFNKLISKTRYKVERTFGTIKKQFGGGVARYIGLEKMHTQHLMQAIAYNLYRSPGIIVSCCEKQTVK